MTPKRVSVPLVLACLIVFIAASAVHAAQAPRLRDITMQLRDFPRGTQTDNPPRVYTNSQAAVRDHVPVATYVSHGRVRSYHNSFIRLPLGGLLPAWMERADGEITEYSDAGGARWEYARQRRIVSHDAVISSPASGTRGPASGVYRYPYHAATLPHIGAQSSGFTSDWPSDEFAYTTGVYLLREGRFVVFLRVVGQEGHFAWNHVVALAHRVDGRIRAQV